MRSFWLCFVPLFVAVDAVGVLPLFVALTEEVERTRRRRIILQSVITAAIVAVTFLWCGPALLGFLGVSVPDFMIAGGLVLLAYSLRDLLRDEKRRHRADPDSLGAVPIGVPLITGPAVLTTCVLLAGIHGRLITTVGILTNIVLAGGVFLLAEPITRVLGSTGTKTASKLASLLLAVIAVMMMRRGVVGTLKATWM